MLLDKRIQVLCFSEEPTVQGLQWAFEQKVYSGRSYSFFVSSLSRPPENLGDYDLYLLTLDLGQPVPMENLRKLPARPAVCAFLQPTPQQLLTIAELPDWSAVAWDGTAFERLALRLDLLASRAETRAHTDAFLESCRFWMGTQGSKPAVIEFADPPASWEGPRVFALDPNARVLSFGASASRADVRLPLPGMQEIAELRSRDGKWAFVKIDEQSRVEFHGDAESIRAGDHFEIEELSFQIRIAPEVQEFLGLSRKVGFFEDAFAPPSQSEDRSLAEVCQGFLASWMSGELRVNSGLRSGSIYVKDGSIRQAVSGSVSGVKALFRMLGWQDPQWRFNPGAKLNLDLKEMDLGFVEFAAARKSWKDRWSKLQGFLPPPHMKLRAMAPKFSQKVSWTSEEYQVVASVCEFQLVRDIFNNCRLNDVEILAALVDMRRSGLIEPMGR